MSLYVCVLLITLRGAKADCEEKKFSEFIRNDLQMLDINVLSRSLTHLFTRLAYSTSYIPILFYLRLICLIFSRITPKVLFAQIFIANITEVPVNAAFLYGK